MKKKNHNKNSQIETSQLSKWFTNVLSEIRELNTFYDTETKQESISPTFRSKCYKAVEVALALEKLRKERQHVGFVPLSISDYVQGLAKLTTISLSSVLSWLGIVDLSKIDATSAKAITRLMVEIGCSLRETLIHIRISFVKQFNSIPIQILLAHHRSTDIKHNQLENYEIMLNQFNSNLEPKLLKELRQIESEVNNAYKEKESESNSSNKTS